MYTLADFSLQDMTACSTRLRRLSTGATTMEEVANRLVRYLYEHLTDDKTHKPACALVRLYRTQRYADLSHSHQACVRQLLDGALPSSDMKCVSLVATAGERLEWNHVDHSQVHKAIPLESPAFPARFPMFSQLFVQLGGDTTPPSGSTSSREADQHGFNVFHVPHVLGSPFVPAQRDFVIPYGIQSALAFGGSLPTRNLFAVILFAKVFLSEQTAEFFKTLGLSTQLALLPFDGTPSVQSPSDTTANGHAAVRHAGAQVATLEQLLAVHEEAVVTYAAQQKRAEEALHDSDARLSAMMQSTKDVTLFIDQSGLITSWNHTAEALFGYSAQEVYCKSFTTILDAEGQEAFEQSLHLAVTDAMQGMTGTTFESVGQQKNGGTFPLGVSLSVCKSKTTVIVMATVRDLTERKQRKHVEAALEKSESHLRSLVEHAPDTMFTLSADGMITSLNPAFETMTHWSRKEWVGEPFERLVHPDDVTTARGLLESIRHDHSPLTCTLRIRSRDRGILTGEFVWTTLMEDRQVVGLLAIGRDNTERKMIETALRENEEQLRSVVQSTKDGIISLDRHGQVTFWNRGAEEIFGYTGEQMLGQPVTRVIPERFRKAHEQGIMRAAEAGHLTVSGTMFELVGLRQDGTEFPLEFTLAAWKTQSGLFFTGVIRDITERKRSDEAINALVQGTSSVTGEEFFPAFVKHLATALGISYAFVTEIVAGSRTSLRVLASWEKTGWGTTFEYEAGNTPCGSVLHDGRAYYAVGIQQVFPDDQYLSDLDVTSYLGMALVSSTGEIIGHICVMDGHPLKNEQQATSIMNIFAARAAAELERLHATTALRHSEARQALILNALPIAFYTAEASGEFPATWVSDNLERLTGFPARTLLEMPQFWVNRLHPDDRDRVLADVKQGQEAGTVSTEYRWRIADGSYRWYLDNAVYTRDSHGNSKELIGAWIDITRRKRTEEALQQSETRFKAFMDHTPAVIFMKDQDGRYVYVNQELESVLQLGAEEWLGKTDYELWPPEMAEQFRTNDREVLKSNAGLEVVETTVSSTGKRQYWRVIKFPIHDVAGRSFLGGIAVDLTANKVAEEAVREVQERYRGIFENAVEGIFQTTREGRYLTVNPALVRICGYGSAEEMMASVTDIGSQIYVDPLRRAECMRLVEQQGSITGFESQIRRPDGSVIWISECVRGRREADGRLVGYEGTVENISARKQAEEALRESQERLALCVQGSAAGLWDWDIGRQQVYLSSRWKQMLGYEDHEFQGGYEDWETRLHPDDRARALRTLQDYFNNKHKSQYQLEHRLRHKDGSYRWVLANAVCLRDQEGHPYRMTGSNIDITNLKKTEEQLQSALTRLRTLSGRLEVIREEERGRIARELHDEFGVGLTCLKIDLSRLKSMMGTTAEGEKRRLIEEKIRSMEEFIDTTIGGVQRIVSELRPAILDDLGLVAAIEWQAQDFQRRTGIASTLELHEEHLMIDSERATVVFRICQEALTNVARHARATAVQIRLEASQESVILEVADNGCGIPDEKIADPRALGLLGMRERAELFGGLVTIARRRQEGTVVTLHVPCFGTSSVVERS